VGYRWWAILNLTLAAARVRSWRETTAHLRSNMPAHLPRKLSSENQVATENLQHLYGVKWWKQ
jgi:hypothetical protein